MDHVISQIRDALARASHVLIGAGAGLTAAAGYDYTDEGRFAELFPDMVRRGFSNRAQLIGRPLPQPLLWGYWGRHVFDVRYREEGSPLYRALRAAIGDRDHFVWTSNVDSFFVRSGFDPGAQFVPQGDYGLLQCAKACHQGTWDFEPVLVRLLPTVDRVTGKVADEDEHPRCPRCGGPAWLNVRVGREFVEEPHLGGLARLRSWISRLDDEPLLLLELGAGFNTPGVVRWPMERLAATRVRTTLVRVNVTHSEVPPNLPRALGARVDIADVIHALGEGVSP